MSTPFDHQEHIESLRDAERELLVLGKDKLAAAVGRAIALHVEFQGRIYQAKEALKQIKRTEERLYGIAQDMERYVTSNKVPWISPDQTLFDK